jgi:DhnA family fructose-bisphosphate aldolase class Ia
MNIGKRIRLNRLFAHPSGRLCSVAVDHFIGYGKLTPGGGLSDLPGALQKIVAGLPGAVTMSKGTAMIECGADVIKVGYTGDVDSFRQIVESSPVPVIAAGGPKAVNLRAALDAMTGVVDAGGHGATIGRNVWEVEPVTVALKAFKAVILDGISPENPSPQTA